MSTKIIPPKITNGFLCDSEPTENSTNLMTSGDIYTAIQSAGGGGGNLFGHTTTIDPDTGNMRTDLTYNAVADAIENGIMVWLFWGHDIYHLSYYYADAEHFGWYANFTSGTETLEAAAGDPTGWLSFPDT